jgi:hypothetical protein
VTEERQGGWRRQFSLAALGEVTIAPTVGCLAESPLSGWLSVGR